MPYLQGIITPSTPFYRRNICLLLVSLPPLVSKRIIPSQSVSQPNFQQFALFPSLSLKEITPQYQSPCVIFIHSLTMNPSFTSKSSSIFICSCLISCNLHNLHNLHNPAMQLHSLASPCHLSITVLCISKPCTQLQSSLLFGPAFQASLSSPILHHMVFFYLQITF